MDRSRPQPILAVEGLTKDFPSVRALDDVSLSFSAGEVHGVIGENGAGKSTLMKIIAGLYRPTAGRIVFRGESVRVTGPADAMRLGISMVHQELNLVDELTAGDNIFLGRERTKWGLVDRGETLAGAGELLERVGCDVDPAAKVKALPIAGQQMVEIAKSLSFEAAVLIMDEPTAVLTAPETARLFELIGRLRGDGVTVLYISHILPEVLEICDRITVMRDGQVVRTLPRGEIGGGRAAEAMLGSLMVGREMGDHFPQRIAHGERIVLSVGGLSVGGAVRDVSFDVRAGEILGFAGLVGAGRTETAEAVVGLRPRTAGTVTVDGAEVAPDINEAVRCGLAYLSEDRAGRGLFLGRSVIENTTIVSLRRYTRGLIRRAAEREATLRRVRELSIKIARPADPVDTLSGGNQQKVALAKWLETAPKVLILDEPTRGIDIGAKEEIYRLIQRLACGGMACVFISSELNELLGVCHRIAVMRGGRIVAVVEGDEMTEENVMFHAAGVAEAGAA